MDQPSGTRKGIGADVMSGPGKVGSVYDGRGLEGGDGRRVFKCACVRAKKKTDMRREAMHSLRVIL